MPFIQLPSEHEHARIYYELTGESNLPVLVLAHSLGTDLTMWDPQMPGFAAHYRILRYDGRGQGRSSVTPGPYSMAQLGRDVLDLLDRLGIDRAHFCGLSMGGMIGQALGAGAAGRLEKLVLANTAAKIGDAESWNARIRTIREQGVQAVAPSVVERWYTAAFRSRAPDTVARCARMLEAADPEGYTANCAAVRDFDQRAALGSIRVPTLIIAGAGDLVTPPADGRFITDSIPGAQYIELEAAHLSNVEASSAFTAAVVGFLEGDGL